MTISEPLRSTLFVKLEQAFGTDEASALMNHLPSVEASEAVTKEYLKDYLDLRFAESEARVVSQVTLRLLPLMVTMNGLLLAAFKLLG
jgi:hypothetical protein